MVLQADELRYVYQRLGFQCLVETLFDDAGRHFFAGNLDPRVLIRYYPELCGSLFDTDASADVFAGVVEHMPPEDTIDDISESPAPTVLTPIPHPPSCHPILYHPSAPVPPSRLSFCFSVPCC